jgi:hypothetical protein
MPQTTLDQFIVSFDKVVAKHDTSGLDPDDGRLLAMAAGALRFAAAAAGTGECRRSVPYATLRPVLGDNGEFRWCCTHSPEHCGG